jgi:hypothetical protein
LIIQTQNLRLYSGFGWVQLSKLAQNRLSSESQAKDHDWYLYCYASTLVHEATHGAIYSGYVTYTKRNRLRIEKLCHTEERRFLQNLDAPDRSWPDQIAGVFDEQYFLQYFSANWLSRVRIIWKRISEVRKDA